MARECYFPSGPDGHLAPSYAISRLGPRAAASNYGRRHGGHTGWCGSENSRRGLVGEIISPLWLGRVGVRVMGRVGVRIGVELHYNGVTGKWYWKPVQSNHWAKIFDTCVWGLG